MNTPDLQRHYESSPGRAWCQPHGFQGKMSTDPAHVTCPQCLRFVFQAARAARLIVQAEKETP